MESITSINAIFGMLVKSGAGAAALIVLAALFIRWRTRSSHTIMIKIWSFFSANRNASIKSAKQFYEKQAALLQFRFTTGINVRTLPQMESVIGWSEKHNEDIGAIAACGTLFDLEKPGLRDSVEKLKWWFDFFPLAICTLLFSAGILAISFAIPDSAIVQFKESRTFFMLEKDSAKRFNGRSVFSVTSCGSTGPENTGFTLTEKKVLCEAFAEKGIADYVRSTVALQKWILSGVAIFMLLACTPFWFMLTETVHARAMHRRLSQNDEQQP